MLSADFFARLFARLNPFIKNCEEISIEANPNSLNYAWLQTLFKLGVNRLSMGVQSFDERKLAFLDRSHSKKEVYISVENAKKVGFENINIDLIYDTYLDNLKLLKADLACVKELEIQHLSAYALSLEKNTSFYKKKQYLKNDIFLARSFVQNIEDLGFKQYEISNFGKICKHNLSYWTQKPYLGCGLSAVGFKENKRFFTKKSLKEYIKDPIFREIEELSKADLLLEHIMLGCRSKVGIRKALLSKKQLEKALFLVNENKIYEHEARLYNKDYFLADEIALFIYS